MNYNDASFATALKQTREEIRTPSESLMEAIFSENKKKYEESVITEAFEVYSIGDNGQRAGVPTTDSAGKSKYSDAASAEMQKIKLEKQSPGKKWTIVQVQDEKNKTSQRTAKQQGTAGSAKKINESEEVLSESAGHSKDKADSAMKRAGKFPEGSTLKNAALASHHGNMNTYHEKMTDHHVEEARKAEAIGDKVTEKLHIDQINHHQDQAKEHRQKRSGLLAKIASAHTR